MSFGELRKILPLRFAIPHNDLSHPRRKPAPWKVERSGEFAGYAVSGWRYYGLAIWHVKAWSKNNDQPERTYTVAAGEFYPPAIVPAEKFAILRLIAMWEADGLR